MIFHERSENGWNIKFFYSPFHEMVCSLHVLSNPEHHLRKTLWAKELMEKMKGNLLKEILYFGNNWDEWCTVMNFCDASEVVNDFNIMSALDYISGMDIVDFIYYMLQEQIDKASILGVLNKGKINKGIGCLKDINLSSEQMIIFTDPITFRVGLISCLKEYYNLYFERELRFVEPLLIRIMRKQIHLSERLGIKEYIKTIHSRIEIAEHEIVLKKYKIFTVPYSTLKDVSFTISSFIDPHLLVGLNKGEYVTVTIRANLEQAEEMVPADLFKIMKALGDETRLKILRCLYFERSSTQSIAIRLGISEAAVSKHLKLMNEAELLHKERKGNFIYYGLNNEVVEGIPLNIYQYLES